MAETSGEAPSGHCVFMHRSDSIYDDTPAVQYQFPRQYLSRALKSIGNWILYLEPTKVRQSKGYFAVAKVQQIIPDPAASGMYIALIEPGSYLDFATPVEFRSSEGIVELGLMNSEGKISGRAQAAVRPISAADFNRILERGLDDRDPVLPRVDDTAPTPGLAEEQASYLFEQERNRVFQLTSRAVRDRVFRRIVLRAYSERCAISGLKLINGGGRAEVNAAHIRPVEKNGPDTVHNGIGLSSTAHWMFDRGLISLGDDLQILISRQANDPAGVQAFVNKTGFAIPPQRATDRPHPRFLQWHRENCFKQ
jgi:putative restriction endonuclease